MTDLEKQQIAAKYMLSPTLAARLQGDTAEELEADAQQLATALNAMVAASDSERAKAIYDRTQGRNAGLTAEMNAAKGGGLVRFE